MIWLRNSFLLVALFYCSRLLAADLPGYEIGTVKGTNINIRESPLKTANVVGAVNNRESFAVERRGDWYLILDGPHQGKYIFKDFIKILPDKLPIARAEGETVNVRIKRDKKSQSKGVLKAGSTFAAKKDGDWFEIQDGPYKGGFVSAEFVKWIDNSGVADITPTPEPIPVNSNPLKVVALPEPSPSPIPPSPTPVKSEVLPSDVKAEPKPLTGQILGSNINVRANPDKRGKLLGRVNDKEIFEIEQQGDWYLLKNGKFSGGYVFKDFMKVIPPEEAAPAVPAPTSVEGAAAQSVAEPVVAPVPVNALKGKIKGTNINVRARPQKNGRIMGRVNDGDEFEFEENGEWYRVKSGPLKDGYVFKDFIVLTPPTTAEVVASPTPEPVATEPTESEPVAPIPDEEAAVPTSPSVEPAAKPIKGKVKGSSINVREQPRKKARVVGLANNGDEFTIEPEGDWYKIQFGKFKDKYIFKDFITLVSEDKAAPQAEPTPLPVLKGKETKKRDEPPPVQWDPKKEEIFQQQVEKAFSKGKMKGKSETEVIMPIYFEDETKNGDEITTFVKPNGSARVNSATLFEVMKKYIAESWFEKPDVRTIFTRASAEDQWVDVSVFNSTSVRIEFSHQKLEIRLRVPAELRKTGNRSLLRAGREFDLDSYEKPAKLSSYLNINASEVLDSRFEGDKRAPIQGQLENATNINGYILEAFGRFNEPKGSSRQQAFQREDIRLVHDFPSKGYRASLGDVVYPVQSFQSYRAMGGAAISSQFSMLKSKLTYPAGEKELFLKRKSKVYVWVNDQLQQVLELQAGRHQLSDFPFSGGMNNVRFEILDDVGQTETVTYDYFSNSELLRPGLSQMAYAIGAPSTSVNGQRTYESGKLTFSGFHRLGLSQTFTAGLNLQRDNQYMVLGGEGLFSTDLGFIKFEPAFSTGAGSTGFAFGSRYVYTDYKGAEKTQRTLNASAILRTKGFNSLGSIGIGVKTLYEFTLSHTRGLSRLLSLNTSGQLRIYDKSVPGLMDSFAVSLGFSRSWGRGISSSLTFRHARTERGTEELSALGFLIWSMPEDNQVITAVHNTNDRSSRLDWSYNPSSGADSGSISAGLRDSQTEQGYGGQYQINANRGRASIGHDIVISKSTDSESNGQLKTSANVTTIQMGTALVYAGGYFGISRPVTDSFVIVKPEKNLVGETIEINPISDGTYLARSTWLGAAVAPEVSSYMPSTIAIGTDKLPAGASVPRDHFDVYPSYKSGFGFGIGTDASVYVVVIIQGPDGKPIGPVAGRAVYLDDPKQDPLVIFTNRKGQMRSEGFRPGRWAFEIATDDFQPYEFVIPSGDNQEYDLRTIKLKAKQ